MGFPWSPSIALLALGQKRIKLHEEKLRGVAMPFAELTMLLQEIEVVQDVFETVVGEAWFHRTMFNEKEFAEFVLRGYRSGITDRDRLFVYCHEAAELFFTKNA